jgi:PBP1b-binding outer membrane lipoprotein LpoB
MRMLFAFAALGAAMMLAGCASTAPVNNDADPWKQAAAAPVTPSGSPYAEGSALMMRSGR